MVRLDTSSSEHPRVARKSVIALLGTDRGTPPTQKEQTPERFTNSSELIGAYQSSSELFRASFPIDLRVITSRYDLLRAILLAINFDGNSFAFSSYNLIFFDLSRNSSNLEL